MLKLSEFSFATLKYSFPVINVQMLAKAFDKH